MTNWSTASYALDGEWGIHQHMMPDGNLSVCHYHDAGDQTHGHQVQLFNGEWVFVDEFLQNGGGYSRSKHSLGVQSLPIGSVPILSPCDIAQATGSGFPVAGVPCPAPQVPCPVTSIYDNAMDFVPLKSPEELRKERIWELLKDAASH